MFYVVNFPFHESAIAYFTSILDARFFSEFNAWFLVLCEHLSITKNPFIIC